MRIAHIVNSLTKASGLSFFCSNMTQHLAELGVDIDLYVWWVGDDALLPNHERITVHETKDTGFNPVIKPDVVHVHSLWVPIAHQGCVYARKNKIPYVLSPHGMLTPWALRHKWWKKLPGMILYQYRDLVRASMLHATAPGEVANIRTLRLKQDVAVVPLGTDLPSAVEKKVRLDRDYVRTVLFVGRVHPVKGLQNLLEAWNAVKHEELRNFRVSWRLVIAGPDAMGHKAELLRLAESLKLKAEDLSQNFSIPGLERIEKDTDIVFTGSVYGDDKSRLHAMADLLVLPSFTENFGAVVTDSLAFGVPVITTKGTPWSELRGSAGVEKFDSSLVGEYGEEKCVSSKMCNCASLTDELPNSRTPKLPSINELSSTNELTNSAPAGRCGWWIDIGVEPLVDALRKAMSMTDEERRTLGANGRRLVEKKYTWPAVAGKMKKAYEITLSLKEQKESSCLH